MSAHLARSQYGVGQYRASEGLTVIVGRGRATTGAVPVLYAHGSGGTGTTAREAVIFDDLAAVAAAGYPVLAGDFGGTQTWGNDATQASFDDAVSWAGTNLGTRTDKVAFFGESMGGCGTLNWMWRTANRSKVAAALLRVPIVALDYVHDNVPFFAVAIENSYGGLAAYNAALPTHDPAQNHALLSEFASRIWVWYATADEVTPPALTLAFAAAVGCEVEPVTGGHAAAASTPPDVVAAWLHRTIRAHS